MTKIISQRSDFPTITAQLVHLEAEYRYLSQAAYAWNKLYIEKKNNVTAFVDKEFAELSTIIQDSILVHTRNLLEFYKSESRGTDICLTDLLRKPENALKFCNYICNNMLLQNLKKQIEVHLFHMTYHRVLEFRKDANNSIDRPDFNNVNCVMFNHMLKLLELLEEEIKIKHKDKIKELIDMTKTRYKSGSSSTWNQIFNTNDSPK